MTARWLRAALAGGFAFALVRAAPAAWLPLQAVAVIASAAPIGAVAMLAIGRLVGADWRVLAAVAPALPIPGALLVAAALAAPVHVAGWAAPVAVAARTLAALIALQLAAVRLSRDGGATPAALILAGYAVVVTPVAADWLLPAAPTQPSSAIGMILFVQQIAAACAVVLVGGTSDERRGRDLARLMVAALLALGYLAFMDFLIVWYGNLPRRVPFYLDRMAGVAGAAPAGALLLGIAAPIAVVSTRPGAGGRREAGLCALAAVGLFDGWWLGGAPLTLLAAMMTAAVVAGVAWRSPEARHG